MKKISNRQSPIEIRELLPQEAEAADRLYDLVFLPLRSVYMPVGHLAEHQASRRREGVRLVALLEGRAAGIMQYRLDRLHIHLLGLAVHPDARRRGIARQLIAYVEALAPSLGHSVLALDTIRETGNVPLFERCGFHVVRESIAEGFVSERFPVLHSVIMEKSL